MGPADASASEIGVEVVYAAAPHDVDLVQLRLRPPVTAIEAVRRSGLLERHALAEAGLKLGVWGRACGPEHGLRERDRVELYRPLKVDPKEARRLRYKGRANRRKAL